MFWIGESCGWCAPAADGLDWELRSAAGCVLLGVVCSFGPMRVLDEWRLSLGVGQVARVNASSRWVEVVLESVGVV